MFRNLKKVENNNIENISISYFAFLWPEDLAKQFNERFTLLSLSPDTVCIGEKGVARGKLRKLRKETRCYIIFLLVSFISALPFLNFTHGMVTCKFLSYVWIQSYLLTYLPAFKEPFGKTWVSWSYELELANKRLQYFSNTLKVFLFETHWF